MTKATFRSGTTSIVRLDRQELAALDLWNARFDPEFTRPQAIRFSLRNQLLQLDLLSARTDEDAHWSMSKSDYHLQPKEAAGNADRWVNDRQPGRANLTFKSDLAAGDRLLWGGLARVADLINRALKLFTRHAKMFRPISILVLFEQNDFGAVGHGVFWHASSLSRKTPDSEGQFLSSTGLTKVARQASALPPSARPCRDSRSCLDTCFWPARSMEKHQISSENQRKNQRSKQ
jgi:hypothetical protein